MTGGALEAPGRRGRRKAETRNRVLEAARALFGRQRYEAVTIRMIADEAGIAVGSVFTTFESKTDVLAAIVADELEAPMAAIDAAVAVAEGPERRLSALFSALYRYHDRHIDLLIQGMSHSWVRSDEAERTARRAIAPTLKRMETILIAARDAGEIGGEVDLRTIVEVLFAAYIANFRGAAFDGWSAAEMSARMDRQIAAVLRGAGLQR